MDTKEKEDLLNDEAVYPVSQYLHAALLTFPLKTPKTGRLSVSDYLNIGMLDSLSSRYETILFT